MEEALSRRVAKNSFFNVTSILFDKFFGLIFAMIVARLLQPELFGVYNLALSVGYIFLTFMDLGIHTTLVRWVSHSLKNNKPLARSYFRYLLKIKLLLAIVVGFIMFMSAPLLSVYLFNKPYLLLPLQIVTGLIFARSFLDFLISLSSALQKFKYHATSNMILSVSRVVLVPLLIILGLSVGGAILGMIFSVMIAFVVLIITLKSRFGFMFTGETVEIEKERMLKFLSFLTLGSITGIFYGWVDSIMIGIFMPVEAVGFYRAAFAIIFIVAGVANIANVLFPVFTQMSYSKLKDTFHRVFRYSSVMTIPSVFIIIYLSTYLVKFIYGDSYLPAVTPIIVLSLLVIEVATFSVFSIILSAKEMPKYPSITVSLFLLVNIVLNFFLIQMYGILGAAIATVLTRYMNSLSLMVIVKIKLNIFPKIGSIAKPVLSSLVMIYYLMIIPKPADIFTGMIHVVIAGLIYFGLMFAIKGIKTEDVKYVRNAIGI